MFTPTSTRRLCLLSIILAWSQSRVAAQNETLDPSKDTSLMVQATVLDKLRLMDTMDWIFDFFAQDSYTYTPGAVINADAATFPATIGNGMTLAWVNLGPCAMQAPHYHPRASNYIVSIEGSIETYMIPENGGRLVTNLLDRGKMTLFPKGSLHSMQNTGCGNATLVSALSTEDPGTHSMANGLFNLPPDMVAAAFGNNLNLDMEELGKSIPEVGTGAAMGSADCRAKCGI
ncbi:spherulin-1A [Xylariomycetidae sp. FL0641]|nr:spherulin-1A [Xylariomycetidae sp. FL0641]